MKNLFIIITLSSIPLLSADHPWTRDDAVIKKSTKKGSQSYPDLSLTKHIQLHDDEIGEILLVDAGTERLVKKHEKIMQRVNDVRNDIKGLEKASVIFSCNIKTLKQQVDIAIKPPINITPDAKIAKREQRITTLKQARLLLPLISQEVDTQLVMIKKLISIINDLCPQQK